MITTAAGEMTGFDTRYPSLRGRTLQRTSPADQPPIQLSTSAIGIGMGARRGCKITVAMRRRTLLELPVLAAWAQPKRPNLKLSIRVEPLFPGLPLPLQMERVAEAQYQGF